MVGTPVELPPVVVPGVAARRGAAGGAWCPMRCCPACSRRGAARRGAARRGAAGRRRARARRPRNGPGRPARRNLDAGDRRRAGAGRWRRRRTLRRTRPRCCLPRHPDPCSHQARRTAVFPAPGRLAGPSRPGGHLRGGSRSRRPLHEGQQAPEPDIAPGEAETDRRDVSAAGDGGTGQHQLHALAPATRRVHEDGRRLVGPCRLSGWCANVSPSCQAHASAGIGPGAAPMATSRMPRRYVRSLKSPLACTFPWQRSHRVPDRLRRVRSAGGEWGSKQAWTWS